MIKTRPGITIDPILWDTFQAQYKGQCSHIVEELIRGYLETPKDQQIKETEIKIVKVTEQVKPIKKPKYNEDSDEDKAYFFETQKKVNTMKRINPARWGN